MINFTQTTIWVALPCLPVEMVKVPLHVGRSQGLLEELKGGWRRGPSIPVLTGGYHYTDLLWER